MLFFDDHAIAEPLYVSLEPSKAYFAARILRFNFKQNLVVIFFLNLPQLVLSKTSEFFLNDVYALREIFYIMAIFPVFVFVLLAVELLLLYFN